MSELTGTYLKKKEQLSDRGAQGRKGGACMEVVSISWRGMTPPWSLSTRLQWISLKMLSEREIYRFMSENVSGVIGSATQCSHFTIGRTNKEIV
jgi:hypothetical protein